MRLGAADQEVRRRHPLRGEAEQHKVDVALDAGRVLGSRKILAKYLRSCKILYLRTTYFITARIVPTRRLEHIEANQMEIILVFQRVDYG